MSVEAWKSIFDFGTVATLFLTFAFGFGVWRTSNIINERQARQLRQFEKDITLAKSSLAEQQERAAKAELELKRYVNFMASAQGPRSVPTNLILSTLRKAPPARIEVFYQVGNPETFLFASSILGLLRQAGWQASEVPSEITSMVGIGGATGLSEIVVAMKHTERSEAPTTTEGALWAAVIALKRARGERKDEALAEDEFKLYVGPVVPAIMWPLPLR
jgi:hypothetical protein